ncbi:hypothetical protein [Diaminobutyricimonas sp. LJ205]|uniref:hypothetical protein n=1 Tax=Diaminobutyricimonas sp. LJ205 TaxID=2683590 RepID=UPI0012F4FABF|nr:hypothetical protein [Diaminobutyricimonas sp. LJ205]
MTTAHPVVARCAAGTAAVLVVAVLGVALSSGSARADDEVNGNLSVVVDDGTTPTPTPSGSAPPTTPPSPPNRPITPPGQDKKNQPSPVVEQETMTNPGEADEALGDDPSDLGGILWVSGLTAVGEPSFAPENGTVQLTFTLRNTSSTQFNSRARFWITNALGARIAEERHVRVDDLEPDETRRVSVTFAGLAQHAMLTGHVQLTPPAQVEKTKLSSFTRDTLVFFPPLFGMSVAGGVGALGGLVWWAFGATPHGPARLRPLGGHA